MRKNTSEIFTFESDEDFLKEFGKYEVKVPDTVTDKMVDIPGGLLDQAIFGCSRNYVCRCGEYNGIIYEGEVCEKCGVEVTSNRVTKTRYGYAKLHIDLVHPLYETVIFTKILRVKAKDIPMFYGPNQIFFSESAKGPLKVVYEGQELRGHITYNSGLISLGYGIEAVPVIINMMIKNFNVHSYFDTRKELYDNLIQHPTISILRLLPTFYRPIYLNGKNKMIDSLNITYKSVVSFAHRIRFYKEGSDKYYLNGAFWFQVDNLRSLMDKLYVHGGLVFKGTPIKTYPKVLSRKGGLIRGNLLGKRSDFSSRSVNTSVAAKDINVAYDEMIVPFTSSKNLLRVHLMKKLNQEFGYDFSESMRMIDENHEVVMNLMKEMDGKYYIYTCRAPSLYKQSFMGFLLRINFDLDDKTIKIHPLQNSMFNLDYDGDQMGLFLPITIQAQSELRDRAVPSSTPFYDKNGAPIYEFTLEFIYGLYYMTDSSLGTNYDVNNPYYCDYTLVDGKRITKGSEVIKELFDTYGFDEYYELGQLINKKFLGKLVYQLLSDNPDRRRDVLILLNELMKASTAGFSESGLSIKFSDFIDIDKSKLKTIDKTIDYILEEEKLIKELESKAKPDNAFMSMLKSGAKGNYTQIKQVMIGKGILVDGNGDYLPPIKNSLADGLDFDEFITTISAGRQGMVSKSLSTAKTGYLYYRLVKSLRDYQLVEEDCRRHTPKLIDGIYVSLKDAEGRYLSEAIDDLPVDSLIIGDNFKSLTSKYDLNKLIKVRSPLTCSSEHGVCCKCYGIEISRGTPSYVGMKAGIITGSSLSEVLSQAMLRNFHTAGSTNIDKETVKSKSNIDKLEVVDYPEHQLIKLDKKEYLIPKSNLTIHKMENISSGDEVFSYNVGNSDINRQYNKLESILESKKSNDPAVVAPIDGLFEFVKIVDEVVKVKDKKIGLEVPKRVRNVVVKIVDGDKSKILNVPYHKIYQVPFNSYVKKGQLLTDGDINYKTSSSVMSADQMISSMLHDLDSIYLSQGSDIRSIHFEVVVNHLLTVVDEKATVNGITNQGLDRSFIQHMSLGWYGKAMADIFDELKEIGNTNADRVVLGTYK